jgi:hypothetical protein
MKNNIHGGLVRGCAGNAGYYQAQNMDSAEDRLFASIIRRLRVCAHAQEPASCTAIKPSNIMFKQPRAEWDALGAVHIILDFGVWQ